MKYAYIALLSIICCACSPQLKQFTPNHVGISPSVEWECQKGENTKTKPKISSSVDWNF